MSKVRIGVIGTGLMGAAAHVGNLANVPEAELVAICDTDPDNLKAAAELAPPGCAIYSDSDLLIETAGVDAVIIATPNHTHRPIAEKAFSLGKHVLTEKPMATTLDDCRAMIEASERAGKLLQVGLLCRYSPLFHRFVELIRGGAIGKLQMMFCKEFRAPFQDLLVRHKQAIAEKSARFADSEERPTTDDRRPLTVSEKELKGWWRMREISGGALVEKNCHHFDVFNWMLGDAVPAKRVFATGGRNVHTQFEIIDHAWVTVDYANGVKACLGLCFFAPWGEEVEWWAVGDKGKAELHLHKEGIHLITSRDKREAIKVEFPGPREIGHRGSRVQIEEFVRSIMTGAQPYADGAIGLRSIAIPIAAEESIRTGAPVEL